MNRRGFLGGLIGVVAAPAVVRAESLMKIWVPPSNVVLPLSVADRIAMFQGELLRHAIPVKAWEDAAMFGTGVAIPHYEGGVIKFRRVSPFGLFPDLLQPHQ